MSRRRRDTLLATVTTAVVFPLVLAAVGVPLGLFIGTFTDASTTMFWLSIIPGAAAVAASAELCGRLFPSYFAAGPILLLVAVLIVAAAVTLLGATTIEQSFAHMRWCMSVAAATWIFFGPLAREQAADKKRLVP